MLAGGHSIQDDVPKYGLSVSGFVHPDRILKNCGAVAGDVLILTKPLGTGIVNTAVKAELASKEAEAEVIGVMTSLNKKAKQIFDRYEIHACTDVTGFGLAGHSLELAKGSGVTVEIDGAGLPLQAATCEYAKMGLIPEGAYKNRAYAGQDADVSRAEEWLQDIFFDPQTSGGLLVSVTPETAEKILSDFQTEGLDTPYAVVGRVLPKEDVWVRLTGGV